MSISRLSLFNRSNGFWYIIYFDGGRQRWNFTGGPLRTDTLKKLAGFQGFFRSKTKPVSLSRFMVDFLSYASTTYVYEFADYTLQAVDISIPITYIRSVAISYTRGKFLPDISQSATFILLLEYCHETIGSLLPFRFSNLIAWVS